MNCKRKCKMRNVESATLTRVPFSESITGWTETWTLTFECGHVRTVPVRRPGEGPYAIHLPPDRRGCHACYAALHHGAGHVVGT